MLAKDLKEQFFKTNIKQKVTTKIGQMNLDIFSNHILLVGCLFQFIQIMAIMLKDLMLKNIYQKAYSKVII